MHGKGGILVRTSYRPILEGVFQLFSVPFQTYSCSLQTPPQSCEESPGHGKLQSVSAAVVPLLLEISATSPHPTEAGKFFRKRRGMRYTANDYTQHSLPVSIPAAG